jgi:hypothetical protein
MTRSTATQIATAPRKVWCLIEGQHTDRTVADLATTGRFVHHGVTLHLGRRPDWVGGGLPSDAEWRIEWIKLYEGLHLAHAFGLTGDPVYQQTWEDLVDSFCEQIPVGHDTSDVTARRTQNWLYAWQQFDRAECFSGFTPGFEERLADRLLLDVQHLRLNLTPERNHRTLEIYSLLLTHLALNADLEPAREALDLLADNAATDIWPDGVHRECSTDYHMLVLRSLVGAIANAEQFGLEVPGALRRATERASTFAVHVQRPDGATPSFSDGDVGHYGPFLADAARVLDRPDLAWVASRGAVGAPPRERSTGFPIGGYYTQRSGWGTTGRHYAGERFALFDCGPLGDGGHGHYDQLSVELYAAGQTLVVDPGRFTYADGPDGWRHWFKGTAGHNTLTVDDLDQVSYRPGKPKGPQPTARLVGRWTVSGLDVLVGEATSPVHDATHRRTLAMIDDDHWLVHDEVSAQEPHTYAVRWHLDARAHGRTTLQVEADDVVCRAPGVSLRVPRGCGQVRIEQGWVSPSYGVREPAPVLVISAEHTRAARIVTVIAAEERS